MNKAIKKTRLRLAATGAAFALAFLALGLRAVQLQIFRGPELKGLGDRQHLVEWMVRPKRGSILDRTGDPVAVSIETRSVYARPRRLQQPKLAASRLARALGMDRRQVQQKLKSPKPFVWIKRQVAPREATAVQSLRLKGVGMYYEPRRYYPQGWLAGQVIGFVGSDSQGLEGIEKQYDDHIRGKASTSVVERDALGRKVIIQGLEQIDVNPGADVHLTLETSIQHQVEKRLEATVKRFRAKGGIAVMLQPFSGEVLAMAHYPFFNPNRFQLFSSRRWRNRAVTDSHEPGSAFKAMVAAAALEEGVVGPEDLIYCEKGRYVFGGRVIHDSKEHGWLPFYRVIQFSSNIGTTKIAEKLGKKTYFKYIRRFGFGQPTGIDIPGEAGGLVRTPDRWSRVDLATHSFGQGISVTPIQLVSAYAAIANGGLLMRPFVVSRVEEPGGRARLENRPRVMRRVISERTARLLTDILKGVVAEGGTGLRAGIEGFQVAGKTGTAQKVDLVHGGYAATKRIASFVGFVPADKPRLVLLVMLDEPRVNVYGGVVAAPAFREMARGTLNHMGVVPAAVSSPVGSPEKASLVRVKMSGRRTLERGAGPSVPDFFGLSLREAMIKAKALQMKVKLQGNGYVVKQSPPSGTPWQEGQALILSLRG